MKSTQGKSTLPRMRFLPPPHAFKVFFSTMSGRHAPVKTGTGEKQIGRIDRQARTVPPSMTDLVSFLQRGTADGRRVIFVHGTPGSANGWADYLISVPPGHLYIAVDRLGYGQSKPESAVVSLARQAQALAPLLPAISGKKAILVGHSSGAPVVLQAALDFPDSVGGLLLLAGAFDPDLEEAYWIQPFGMLGPISRLLPRPINNANQELLGLRRELIKQADRLAEISLPVAIVHGDKDPLVPIANVQYLQKGLKNAAPDTLIVKRADHFIPWHAKSLVDGSLKRLIKRVRQAETSV